MLLFGFFPVVATGLMKVMSIVLKENKFGKEEIEILSEIE